MGRKPVSRNGRNGCQIAFGVAADYAGPASSNDDPANMWFGFPSMGRADGACSVTHATSGVARGWYEVGLWPNGTISAALA